MKYYLSGALAGGFQKLFSITIVFFMRPIVSSSLNHTDFAIWLIYYSALQAMQFLDFGLGNSLVSQYSGTTEKEAQKQIIMQTWITSVLLSFSLCLLVVLLYIASILLTININYLSMFFIILLITNAPISVFPKLMIATKDITYFNLYLVAIQMTSFLTTIIISQNSDNLMYFVLALICPPFLTNLLVMRMMIKQHNFNLFSNVKRSKLKLQFYKGIRWFVSQLALFLAYGFDIYYASMLFEATDVIEYGLIFRISQVLGLSLIFTNTMWPVFNEALARKNFKTAKSLFIKFCVIAVLVGIVGASVIMVMSEFILEFWYGNVFEIDQMLLYCFGIWCILFNFWCVVSAGAGNEILMNVYTSAVLIGAVISGVIKTSSYILNDPLVLLIGSIIGLFITTCLVARKIINIEIYIKNRSERGHI